MKKLIAAVALSLCFSSAAMASEWHLNKNGVAVAPTTGSGASAMAFAEDGFTYMALTFFSDCWPSTYKKEKANILVDGVAVKMIGSCNEGSKMVTWEPMTIKGNIYIKETFTKKSSVTVDGKMISAAGFNKVHKMLTLKSLGGI